MDYELGLRRLRDRFEVPGGNIPLEANILTLAARLLENLDRERARGSTETTRADRAGIIDSLNSLSQKHLGVGFIDLCLPTLPDSVQRQLYQLPAPRSKFRLPYREHVQREYRGERHCIYERGFEHQAIVCIWGQAGVGKSWVGAKLALQWEEKGFSYPPYTGPQRQAFWFECRHGTTFRDVVYSLAEYLDQQGEGTLWQQLQRNPDRAQPEDALVAYLVELLDRGRYLLCFDNAHHIQEDPHVLSLLQKMDSQLGATASKVLLIGRKKPEPPYLGGHELEAMTRAEIQSILLGLQTYDKDWLDEAVASKFVHRLTHLVGHNLELMNVVAIDWFRHHTTSSEADQYLDALDEDRLAGLVWTGEGDARTTLLAVLAVLEEKEDLSLLLSLAGRFGVGEMEARQALEDLCTLRLACQDGDSYCLPQAIREICFDRLRQQRDYLSTLHRAAGDILVRRGDQFAQGGVDYVKAASHYQEAGAYDKMIQVLRDCWLDLIDVGKAAAALDLLDRAIPELERGTGELAPRDWLATYILRGDLCAWLGNLNDAEAFAAQGLEELRLGMEGDLDYEKARLLLRMGSLQGKRGQLEQALASLQESRQLMEAYIGNAQNIPERNRRRHELLLVLDTMSLARYAQAAYAEASTCLQELIQYARVAGSRRATFFRARALVRLGQIHNNRGESAQALERVREARKWFESIDHQWGVGFASNETGRIFFNLGDYGGAAQCYHKCVEIYRNLCDREGLINCYQVLAEIDLIRKDLTGAAQYLEAIRGIQQETGVQLPRPLERFLEAARAWLCGLEQVQQGHGEAGGEHLVRAWEILREIDLDSETTLLEKELAALGIQVPAPEQGAAPAVGPAIQVPEPAPPVVPVPGLSIVEPPIGSAIGRYLLQEKLGGGGMGVVYRAYDPHIGRPVALKVLLPAHGSSPEEAADMAQRFHREAQAAGKLDHPNIVRVYDAGIDQDRWYIVMEYLEGRPLSEIIRQDGPQPLDRVTAIVLQVCAALGYAHQQGIVHRDIKPANIIIVGESGEAKVVDLGLASIPGQSRLTQAGTFLGTYGYASPEQINDPTKADGRSDIFALGVVVYELLTGSQLFPGEGLTPIGRIISPEPVDLRPLDGAVPALVRRVLEKALDKDASRRFATCADFSQAFADAARGSFEER